MASRYMTDPVYREVIKARVRAYQSTPAGHEVVLRAASRYAKKRYATDSVFRETMKARSRARAQALRAERYATDPVYRQRRRTNA